MTITDAAVIFGITEMARGRNRGTGGLVKDVGRLLGVVTWGGLVFTRRGVGATGIVIGIVVFDSFWRIVSFVELRGFCGHGPCMAWNRRRKPNLVIFIQIAES